MTSQPWYIAHFVFQCFTLVSKYSRYISGISRSVCFGTLALWPWIPSTAPGMFLYSGSKSVGVRRSCWVQNGTQQDLNKTIDLLNLGGNKIVYLLKISQWSRNASDKAAATMWGGIQWWLNWTLGFWVWMMYLTKSRKLIGFPRDLSCLAVLFVECLMISFLTLLDSPSCLFYW